MVNLGAIIVVIFSSLLKGITGFGFALMALPLLMFWYTPKELIPVLVMCNLVASIFIILQKKEKKLIDKQFQSLIIFGGIFTITGVAILKFISDSNLVQIVSVFFIVLSALSLLRVNAKKALPPWTYRVAGSIIGFLTGSIAVSGPPLALFLNRADVSNKVFREVFAWFSVVTSVMAITGYYLADLITMQSLYMTLTFVPILLAGAIIGKRINAYIPTKIFRYISIVITLFSCVLLLVR